MTSCSSWMLGTMVIRTSASAATSAGTPPHRASPADHHAHKLSSHVPGRDHKTGPDQIRTHGPPHPAHPTNAARMLRASRPVTRYPPSAMKGPRACAVRGTGARVPGHYRLYVSNPVQRTRRSTPGLLPVYTCVEEAANSDGRAQAPADPEKADGEANSADGEASPAGSRRLQPVNETARPVIVTGSIHLCSSRGKVPRTLAWQRCGSSAHDPEQTRNEKASITLLLGCHRCPKCTCVCCQERVWQDLHR